MYSENGSINNSDPGYKTVVISKNFYLENPKTQNFKIQIYQIPYWFA